MSISAKDLQAALPDLESTQCCEGLEKTVAIYRDPWGIPHIQAESRGRHVLHPGLCHSPRPPVAYGLRPPSGFGPLVRMGGALQDWTATVSCAPLAWAAPPSWTTKRLVPKPALCSTHTPLASTPFWRRQRPCPSNTNSSASRPESWESWHCLAVYKMRNSLLGTFESKLWRTRLTQVVGPEQSGHSIVAANLAQLIKGYPQGHLLTVPPGAEYQGEPLDGLAALSRETDPGSNAWSIAGEYTDSGLPLVAGDSHRGSRHSFSLLPSPYRLPRLRRQRLLSARRPRCPALLPQRVRGLGHDLRQRRYPGFVRRALPRNGRWIGVRIQRRVAASGNPAGRNPRPRRSSRLLRGRHYPPRTHHRWRPAQRPSHRHQRPRPHRRNSLGRRSPRCHARPFGWGLAPSLRPLERPRQQLRCRRCPRLLRLSARGPDPCARGRKRLACRPRLERRARVAGLHPPRRVAQSHRPGNRLCHHLQPARDRVQLSILRRARL